MPKDDDVVYYEDGTNSEGGTTNGEGTEGDTTGETSNLSEGNTPDPSTLDNEEDNTPAKPAVGSKGSRRGTAATAQKTRARNAAKVGKSAKTKAAEKVTIVLYDSREIPPGGLVVGINGRHYTMKPEKPTSVDRAVIEVLDHAVRSEAVKDNDNRVVGKRNIPRFPYRIVQE